MKKKLALQCFDVKGRRWTYEWVNIFNFWHVIWWNISIKHCPHQTNGITGDYVSGSFHWERV